MNSITQDPRCLPKLQKNIWQMRFIEAIRAKIEVNDIVRIGINYTYRQSPRTRYKVGRVIQNTEHVLILIDDRGQHATVTWKTAVCKDVNIIKVYKKTGGSK